MINNKVEAIKEHMDAILEILDIPIDANTKTTSLRISKMYCNEFFKNRNGANLDELNDSMKLFPNDHEYTREVSVMNIDFISYCSHHFLPFVGTVDVIYTPDKNIIGLSKIPRVVEYFSKRPQLQENLTQEIGEYLWGILNPKSLRVVITSTHQCVACRGARSECITATEYENHRYTYEY